MTKNKKKSSLKIFKRGFFQTLKARKDLFIEAHVPFIKSLIPQILIILAYCLYVCLGLFGAVVLAMFSIKQRNTPWFICFYTFAYFVGLTKLLIVEHFTKKDRQLIIYILISTPINLAIAFFFNSRALFNFFDELFPQALFLTICAFVFYLMDYNPHAVQKRKKQIKKN